MDSSGYPPPGQLTRRLITRATLARVHPNLDPNTNEIPIHPLALYPADKIASIIVLPSLVDVERLVQALEQILALWPSMTSHLKTRGNEAEFYYDISNMTAPLSIQTIQRDSPFPSLDVMQQKLDPFLEPMDPNFALANSGANQVTFRLTRLIPRNQSVLGVNLGHQLVDGDAANRFLRQLSEFYAKGLKGDSIPRSDFPTYHPHIQLPQTDISADGFGVDFTAPPINDVLRYYAQVAQTHQVSTYVVSLHEVAAIKAEARARSDVPLSTLSLIAAWWDTIEERRDGIRKQQVLIPTNSIRSCYDRPEFPKSLPSLAACCLHAVVAQCPDPGHSDPVDRMVQIALAMKRLIEHDRKNPDIVLEILAKRAKSTLELVRKQVARRIKIPPSTAYVNGMATFDWLFDFGFPKDQVSYHTTHPRESGAILYRSNPRPGQSLPDRGYELATFMPKDQPEMVYRTDELVHADRERWRTVV